MIVYFWMIVANDIIDSWYSEVKDYNFRSGPSGGKKTGERTHEYSLNNYW